MWIYGHFLATNPHSILQQPDNQYFPYHSRGIVPPPLPKAPGVIRRRAENSEAPAIERWCARSPDRPPPGGLRGLRKRHQTPGEEQRSVSHRALVRTKPRSSPVRGIEGVTSIGYLRLTPQMPNALYLSYETDSRNRSSRQPQVPCHEPPAKTAQKQAPSGHDRHW